MVQIIDMGHNVAIYSVLPDTQSILIAVVTTLSVLVAGYIIFRKAQNRIINFCEIFVSVNYYWTQRIK